MCMMIELHAAFYCSVRMSSRSDILIMLLCCACVAMLRMCDFVYVVCLCRVCTVLCCAFSLLRVWVCAVMI